jgi:hypothetical protein
MEGMDFKKLCEHQQELSIAYMKQEKERAKEYAKKYKPYVCVLCCGQKYGFGNNPDPCSKTGRCCDDCNRKSVIPARLKELYLGKLENPAVENKIETGLWQETYHTP